MSDQASLLCLSVILSFSTFGARECDSETTSNSDVTIRPPASATVDQVRTITAELMGVDKIELAPASSRGDQGADELDMVELVMELEDFYGVSIPDDKVEKMMGTGKWFDGI